MAYQWDPESPTGYNNKSGQYKYRKEFGFILRHCPPGNTSLLDIAGGAGRMCIPLKNHFNSIHVTDLSAEALELLKKKEPGIKTTAGDFMTLQFNQQYSYVFCIEALGYFEDTAAFLQKVSGLVEKNGYFIFTYTNPGSWRFILRTIKSGLKDTSNYTDMNFSQFILLLQQNNFEIQDMEGMNWMPLPMHANGFLVTFFDSIERVFGLSKWISQSPWILICVKKTS